MSQEEDTVIGPISCILVYRVRLPGARRAGEYRAEAAKSCIPCGSPGALLHHCICSLTSARSRALARAIWAFCTDGVSAFGLHNHLSDRLRHCRRHLERLQTTLRTNLDSHSPGDTSHARKWSLSGIPTIQPTDQTLFQTSCLLRPSLWDF